MITDDMCTRRFEWISNQVIILLKVKESCLIAVVFLVCFEVVVAPPARCRCLRAFNAPDPHEWIVNRLLQR